MANANINPNRLQELHASGYEMAEGDPDIRGWKVRNLQGQTIGKIDELIFDPQSRKVRYLVVNIEGKVFNITSRKVLMPIGLAELHEENDDVILSNVSIGQLASLPDYNKDGITSDNETSIRKVFAGEDVLTNNADISYNPESFYDHDHFDEDKLYSNRKRKLEGETTIPIIEENINVEKHLVETGGVRVTKNIVEKPVQETVQLKEEHVTVERNAVNKPVNESNFAPFKESTIELTEHAEVPVISKEARIVEEISVGKNVEHRDETIHDTVRKTEVEIEDINKDDLAS